jgi:glutamate formiminotransferase / 5-formyltetrahydrofolate cyclo-ligase
MELVECVPNFSEGRRPDVIKAIRVAAETAGAWVLDVHSDAAHNRSVLTFAGAPDIALEAAFRCVERAARLIDMRIHRGEHPRIGAADVVPFVPLGDTSMARCVDLAVKLGERIGVELGIPVYLYAEAATRPERRWLPDIRFGEYEGLAQEIQQSQTRRPDFGPSRLGAAGATVVGARPFLVAYNVNLRTADLGVALEIAREIRQSSGGFTAVQARGMRTADPGIVQVSMNLLDISVTPAHMVFAAIAKLAADRGVEVIGAELVGLMPMSMSTTAAAEALGLPGLTPSQSVEYRVLEALLSATFSP